MIGREKSIPVLAASTPMSSNTASSSRADELDRRLVHRGRPRACSARSARRSPTSRGSPRPRMPSGRPGSRRRLRSRSPRSSGSAERAWSGAVTIGPYGDGTCALGRAARRGGGRVRSGASRRERPHGADPRRAAPAGARCAGAHRASSRSTSTRPRRGRRPRAASTWSSRPAPPSGKTLAFNLPVLHALAGEPKHRALYLYPTKALAQDQLRSLTALRAPASARGHLRRRHADRTPLADPPLGQRRPDQSGHAPHRRPPAPRPLGGRPHNLRYVVVDEAHVYRGVFGSHVGNVLRRLRRLAKVYGAEPQFVFASATIANPAELAEALAGVHATVVGDDAAPRAERTILLWNPPLLDPELGIRASALGEAARLMADLVKREQRTICFVKSRKAAELIHRFTAERVDRETASRLAPYRAGYTPAQRREIERRLVEGDLLGVSATDALELGIDIGSLDAAISVGFPGTVASLRQQWGRAGRRDHGLAVLVASRGRARPVLHARAGGAAVTQRRGRALRPREPACPRRPRPLGRVRGADRRRRSRRRSATRPSSAQRRSLSSQVARGLGLGRARLPRRRASRSARAARRPSRSSRASPARRSGSSRRSAPTRPSTRARSTSTSASATSSACSTTRRAPRSSRLRRRLVHAGEEGDRDRDRGDAAGRNGGWASSSRSAASR